MDAILTNNNNGYRPQERSINSTAFFRVMSHMAITEDQSLVRISPGANASIMKYAPVREDQQIYIADLVCVGADDNNVFFYLAHIYGPDKVAIPSYIYCLGLMHEVTELIIEDNIIRADSIVMGRAIKNAIQEGMISSYEEISASLLSTPEIDFQLDWSQIIQREELSGSSPLFSDVPYRVKSGVGEDSYSQWRALSPCGLSMQYTDGGKGLIAHLDTGIICSSVLSEHAPRQIIITIVQPTAITPDLYEYKINIDLNIDDIPESSLPWYVMHPGQYLHEVKAQYVYEGSVNVTEISIDADDSVMIDVGDEVQITSNGEITLHEVLSKNDNTITIDGEAILASRVEVRKTEYNYLDGELFNPASPPSFRTPREARMFILRGSLMLAKFPFATIDTGELFNIERVEYSFGAGHDHIYPAYAISNYSIDLSGGSYGESCNIDYDSIEGVRYIGHYGRNPGINHQLSNDIFDIGEPLIPPHPKPQAYLSNGNIASVGKSSIEFDLARKISSDIYPINTEVSGFYQISIAAPPPPIVSLVSISRIYIIRDLINDLMAHANGGGYLIYMKQGEEELLNSIAYNNTTFNISSTIIYVGAQYLIRIDDELIICQVDDKNDYAIVDNAVRGALGTTPSAHAANAPVIVYDPDFKNEQIGIMGNDETNDIISLIDPPDVYVPNTGYIMINGEIIRYSKIENNNITIAERACYGSQRKYQLKGNKVSYLSYFTYGDICAHKSDICSYAGSYSRRISLPLLNDNDPSLYGAIPVYLVELSYETNN